MLEKHFSKIIKLGTLGVRLWVCVCVCVCVEESLQNVIECQKFDKKSKLTSSLPLQKEALKSNMWWNIIYSHQVYKRFLKESKCRIKPDRKL